MSLLQEHCELSLANRTYESPSCHFRIVVGIHTASRIDWHIEIEKHNSIRIPKWELGTERVRMYGIKTGRHLAGDRSMRQHT
jgi:hypothetical protein